MRRLTVGSLFSGIGGIDLGLERAGMKVRWHSEMDPYASRVLAKHWPGVPNHGDITKIDFTAVEPVDVLAGGFPCQDISNAGKRGGIDGARSGLWSEYARAIGDIRPQYVFVENVAALLVRGIDRVLGDLAALGYDAEWDCIPAAAVGAPHRRDRLWLVAHAGGAGRWEVACGAHAYEGENAGRAAPDDHVAGGTGSQRVPAGRWVAGVANSERAGLERYPRDGAGWAGRAEPNRSTRPAGVFGRVHASHWWSSEPDVGRVADGVPSRVDRLRGLGNAVVPQVAELVGGWIVQHWQAHGVSDQTGE